MTSTSAAPSRLDRERSEVLLAYLDDYFLRAARRSRGSEEARATSIKASVAFGDAGTALVCACAAGRLGRPDLLAVARRLLSRPLAALMARSPPPPGASPLPAVGLLYGAAGLQVVRCLAALEGGDRREAARALACYLDLIENTAAEGRELFQGEAGSLAGAAVLRARSRDRRLEALGRRLAGRLVGAAEPGDDGWIRWPDQDEPGLAHGTLGVYLSLLLWSVSAGEPLPLWWKGSLSRLLTAMLDDPALLCPGPRYHGRLCSGFAGLAHVAAAGHEVTGSPLLAGGARAALRKAREVVPPQADLCCGRAGIAAACLTLDRIDPGGPWRRQACDLTLSALLVEPEEYPVTGLYGGEAGVAWVALQLVTGGDAGPALLDLPPGSA